MKNAIKIIAIILSVLGIGIIVSKFISLKINVETEYEDDSEVYDF